MLPVPDAPHASIVKVLALTQHRVTDDKIHIVMVIRQTITVPYDKCAKHYYSEDEFV